MATKPELIRAVPKTKIKAAVYNKNNNDILGYIEGSIAGNAINIYEADREYSEGQWVLANVNGENGIYESQVDGNKGQSLNDEVYWKKVEFGSSRNIGEIVSSSLPLTDAGLHLLDGTLLSGEGRHKDFVDYIAELYNENPNAAYFAQEGYGINPSNIIPTDVSIENPQGYVVTTTTTLEEVYNALNDLHPNYPRWQFNSVASSSPQSFTVMFPEKKNLCYYTVENYADANLTGRIVTAWTLEYTIDNGNSWILCDTRSGIPQTQGLVTTCNLSSVIGNVDGIRFTATAGGIDGWSSVGSVRFYGVETLTPEEHWQLHTSIFGACGKFVYDSENNTVRLPRLTGIVEGTTNINELGNLVEAGLPNITGTFSPVHAISYAPQASGAFNIDYIGTTVEANNGSSPAGFVSFDAWRSSNIYGKSDTVQPQTTKVLVYIVVATSTKTNIQVDIDNVSSDLGLLENEISNISTEINNVSTNLNNFSNNITSMVMPDYSAGVGRGAGTYTESVNGVLIVYITNNNTFSSWTITINGARYSFYQGILGTDGSHSTNGFFPIPAHTSYTLTLQDGIAATFFPLKGDN